jgi:hypothetical protein
VLQFPSRRVSVSNFFAFISCLKIVIATGHAEQEHHNNSIFGRGQASKLLFVSVFEAFIMRKICFIQNLSHQNFVSTKRFDGTKGRKSRLQKGENL